MRFCRRHDALSASGDSTKPENWLTVRRFYLRSLRSQTRTVILLLALTEALKHGPLELVYAGREGFPAPGEQDYGIMYTIAYLISYIYICAFVIIYMPFFSWWVPSTKKSEPNPDGTSAAPTKMETITNWLHKINMIWLPFCTAISALFYVVVLFETLVYVDERRTRFWQLPKNSKQIWKSRGLLLMGIAISTGLGYGAFYILAMTELAKVKTLEYAMIVVPVQINIGLMIGTKMQKNIEKRAAMKAAVKLQDVEEQGSQVLVDEKAALMAGQ